MVNPTRCEFPIPCAEYLSVFFRNFRWFVAHDMRDVVSEAEEQGGICPLEETIRDGDVRFCLASGFQEVRLIWDADVSVYDSIDRGIIDAGQADFSRETYGSFSKYLTNLVLAAFRDDFLFRVINEIKMMVAQLVQFGEDRNAII